jgi:hypothetical protein
VVGLRDGDAVAACSSAPSLTRSQETADDLLGCVFARYRTNRYCEARQVSRHVARRMSSHTCAGWSCGRPRRHPVGDHVSITGGNMVEASVVGFPAHGRRHRSGPRVVPSRRADSPDVGAVGAKRIPSSPALAVGEARRVRNRLRIELVVSLRCECDRPNCTETLPNAAEVHRGTADRFIVVPAHINGGVVVKAADRFFIVEQCASVTACG